MFFLACHCHWKSRFNCRGMTQHLASLVHVSLKCLDATAFVICATVNCDAVGESVVHAHGCHRDATKVFQRSVNWKMRNVTVAAVGG